MGKLHPLLLLMVLLPSCNTIDMGFSLTKPRWECREANPYREPLDKIPKRDTAIFISAICAPEGYDLQRDSAWGNFDCELLLYRNGQEYLRIPAGRKYHVSTDPDMHHIVDGHLYTEYSDNSRSYIGCDGKALFDWEGRELLLGIQPCTDGVWTLSRPRNGKGFFLRLNGREILSHKEGRIFGSFGSPGYWQKGALYLDSGQLCFCFKTDTAEGQELVFAVRDGKEEQISSRPKGSTLDAKLLDGQACVLYNENDMTLLADGSGIHEMAYPDFILWLEGGIMRYKGRNGVAGIYWILEYASYFTGVGNDFLYQELAKSEGLPFSDGEDAFCYNTYDYEGSIMTGCSGMVLGGRSMLLLNRFESGKLPCLWVDGEISEFDINGMLTGINATISPPS